MKERPILFSTPMVQAILDGRKTITRRVVKPQPLLPDCAKHITQHSNPELNYRWLWGDNPGWVGGIAFDGKCPYGQPGDRLYIRENYYQFGHFAKNGLTNTGKQKWSFVPANDEILFEDSPPAQFLKSRDKYTPGQLHWYKRLARFMPKRYARILLEITGIRVERLQDISEDDAINEGTPFSCRWNAPANFGILWESINGPGSWENNPWVWVIEFKRIEP